MQILNFRYANMDFFKTPHIQIRFLGKNPVFKYEFLVLFSHPCNLFLSLKSHLSNIAGGAYFGHSHRVGAGATWNHGREALAAAREAKLVSSI